MYFRIKDVGLIHGDNLYLLVEFWGSAEDRFLGLAPFLVNDFILPQEFDPMMAIFMYCRRARVANYVGTMHNRRFKKTGIVPQRFNYLVGKEGICQ